MNTEEAVRALDALSAVDDPEEQHVRADAVLLASAPFAVGEAYRRVVERTGRWWYA